LNQQENDLSISNKAQNKFLQTIKNLKKKFLWGISSACTPARIAHSFQNLLSLDLSLYGPERSDEINKNFLELHFRTNSANDEVQYARIEKSVLKVQPYSIHNFYLNPFFHKRKRKFRNLRKNDSYFFFDIFWPWKF